MKYNFYVDNYKRMKFDELEEREHSLSKEMDGITFTINYLKEQIETFELLLSKLRNQYAGVVGEMTDRGDKNERKHTDQED